MIRIVTNESDNTSVSKFSFLKTQDKGAYKTYY